MDALLVKRLKADPKTTDAPWNLSPRLFVSYSTQATRAELLFYWQSHYTCHMQLRLYREKTVDTLSVPKKTVAEAKAAWTDCKSLLVPLNTNKIS